MAVEDLFSWYQKKIGSYDKQLWEKTLEQKILHGLTHIQMKSAKPKTDLIDLDLVRGSSFTKAKSKHGFITVARLATLRLLFLPLYAKWWVQQTSGRVFSLFLLLYLSEFVNIAVYFYNIPKLPAESPAVSSTEIVIPIMMMWVLSVIHSEIVATNPGPEQKRSQTKKQRCYRKRRSKGRKELSRRTLNMQPHIHENYAPKTNSRRINWGLDLKTNIEEQNVDVVHVEAKEVKHEESTLQTPDNIKQNIVDGSDTDSQSAPANNSPKLPTERQPVDDDGFESLNGNGSAPSDNYEDVPIQTSPKCSSEQTDTKIAVIGICKTASTECDIKVDDQEKLCKSDEVVDSRCDAWVRSIQDTKSVKLNRQQSAPNLLHESSDSESDHIAHKGTPKLGIRRNSQIPLININNAIDSTCDTEDDAFSSPGTGASYPLYAEATTSATDWFGVTTNSEDCSYSSEYDEPDSQVESNYDHFTYDIDLTPTAILSPCCSASDRVSCTIWERTEIKKAELSVFDISSAIISKVELMPQSMDHFYVGIFISTILAVLPALFRFCNSVAEPKTSTETQFVALDISDLLFTQLSSISGLIIEGALGSALWERTVITIASVQRWVLACTFFFLLAVAERTFKQRFLYAKLFSHLTSSRRARKSDLPHFRLNKVRNIKTWLSVRSYLKKRGLQRSVDVIVSAAFIIALLLLSFLSVELLKDTVGLHSQYNLEAMIWCFGLGLLLLRFMTLGTQINRKYRNLSVLITEQINLYLQIEQKPEKKNELMVANSVLKLAADLLKELESPFKISGLSANPYLYNITKVVILSALSGVLSDMLGFKLKLHKIKVK